ncbi:uncharacterized protein ABDE67_021774 [Symphorus nematophorus]
MNQSEDREEGVRPSRTTLCGGHEAQRIHQRPQSAKPGPGPKPEPSCVSFKSDQSKDFYINFKRRIHQRPQSAEPGPGPEPEPEPEPEPSCVSFKSDRSKDFYIYFKGGHLPDRQTYRKLASDGPGPEPSCVSFKSHRSKDFEIYFKGEQPSAAKKRKLEKPQPSSLWMKSDCCMDPPLSFKDRHQSADQRVKQRSSEVPSAQSAQQHQTHLDSIFQLLEENIVTFVKDELKKIQKVLSSDDRERLDSQREDEEVLDGEEGKQRRSSREAFLKITLNFLRRMKQEELADFLQSRSRPGVCQHKLKANLKKKYQCVFEGIAKAGNPTLLNQIYTELYITEGGAAEINAEHEVRQIETASRKPDRPETTIRQEDVFKPPPGRNEPIRTVMTKGVAGIGKTVNAY